MAITSERSGVPSVARVAVLLRGVAKLALIGGLAFGQLACMIPVLGPNELTEREKALDQARARRDLGMDYLSKGQNTIALRELLFSVEKNPDDPVTQLWLGEGYRRQRHDDKALAAMLRAVELSPTFREAHNNLAAFYLQLERFEDALAHTQILIDDPLYSRPWTAFSNRGRAEFNLGRVDEARKSLETALEFRRDFWPASLNLGILENEAGNKAKAFRHFRKVIEHPVGHEPRAEASYRVAQLLVSMGKRTKAVKYFRASVKNAPESSWAEESRDYLRTLR